MADEYIRRQDAIDAFNRIKNTLKNPETAHYDTLMFYEIEDVLEDVEPVAVVPVVRCKDCKHYYFADNRIPQEQRYVCEISGEIWKPDDFCSYAERREETT